MSSEWINFLDNIKKTIADWESEGCDFPVFRGHADQDWNLEPSLIRLKRDLAEDDYENLEGNLYFDFATYSAKYSRLSSSWEVLFEMRHHGLPTRLLDWSENFSMALYFALSEEAISPTIWMLNPYELNDVTMKEPVLVNPITGLRFNYEDGFLDDDKKTEIDSIGIPKKKESKNKPYNKPVAIVPPLSSERLFAQKGLFTLQGKGNDTPLNLESTISHCFSKFVIPRAAIEDAFMFIQLSGVNEFTAYPDLDGLARYLKRKHRITERELLLRRQQPKVGY